MANNKDFKTHPIVKVHRLFLNRKKTIVSIYFFAFFAGIIQLSLPLGIQTIISYVLSNTMSTSLVILIGLVVLGVLVGGVIQVSQMKLIEKLQQELFSSYALAYAEFLPKIDLGKAQTYLPHKVNHFFDVVTLQKGVAKLLLDVPLASIQLVFGLLVLSFYHPVFIVFGLFLLFVLVLVMRYSGHKGLETSINESDYKYKVAAWLEEIARNLSAFKFTPSSVLNVKRTDEDTVNYLNARTSHFKILVFQFWWLIILKVLITAVMFVVGTYLLIEQQLSIGQFIATEIVILTVISAVEKFIINLETIYDTLTAVNKLDKILELPEETSGAIELNSAEQGISLRAEGLSYHNGIKQVIDDANFTITKGKKVAIVGVGSIGKSTLLRLLGGKIQDYSGTLLINDLPYTNYTYDSIREETGLLINHHEIFEGTLLENLLQSCKPITTQQIVQIAKEIGLSSLIEDGKDGLNKYLISDGKNLSQTEMQKILLLRNLIKQPQLLLLDEPWQAMDDNEKKKIQDYILNQLPQTTVVIVCNDTNFAKKCDVTYQLKGNKLDIIA